MKNTQCAIIKNNEVIAIINSNLKSGTTVKFAYKKVRDALDANREFNLVNAHSGKISRRKSHLDAECYSSATQINQNSKNGTSEFFVVE